MGRVIVAGGARASAPVVIPANFADATWEQVIEACQLNKVPDTWVVGDQKTMTINGTDYAIDIIGKNHDTYSDGSGTAPLTFQLHDCYGTGYAMDDVHNCASNERTGWVRSLMRTSYLPTIMSYMPTIVKNSIKEVNKLCAEPLNSFSLVTVADKLFLLSREEVAPTYAYLEEGSVYAYYQAGNSRIKSNAYDGWWFRTPAEFDSANRFYIVRNSDGYPDESIGATATEGVAFAFCF